MKRLIILFALIISATGAMGAQNNKVRAIFMFQLTRYSSWEVEAGAKSFVVTVVGADDVADEFENVTKGKTIQGLPINVIKSSTARNLPKSDVIYLAPSFADRTRSVISDQYGNKTLVIGGREGMCQNGAQVSLTDDGTKVGFEWSRHNIEKGGVKISPKILSMGKELN